MLFLFCRGLLRKGGRNQFGGFNPGAREAISLSAEEAKRFQRDYVSCEHLLMGILRQEQNVAVKALQASGVSPTRLREALEERLISERESGELKGLTPHCKKAIELTVDEVRRMKGNVVDSGHILLGILRVREDAAAQFLEEMGIHIEQTRVRVWELLR